MTRPTICAAILAMTLTAAARGDDGVHVALVGGVGLAQGQFGGHLEVRKEHFAIFAGTGLIFSTTLNGSGPLFFLNGDSFGGPTYGAVFGGRWYSGESGDRFFLSTQFGFNTQLDPTDVTEFAPGTAPPGVWVHSNATTLTAGWRFKWGAFLLDVGAGGGVVFKSHPFGGGYKADAIPDLTLAIGFEI
jgi:hypothetical protein